jgi:hypothetical protein
MSDARGESSASETAMEADTGAEAGGEWAHAEFAVQPDGHDGQWITAIEDGEPMGVLQQTEGEVVALRVARDDQANQRGLELLAQAQQGDQALTVVPRDDPRTPSPDQVDLRDPADQTAQKFWNERVPPEMAELDHRRLDDIGAADASIDKLEPLDEIRPYGDWPGDLRPPSLDDREHRAQHVEVHHAALEHAISDRPDPRELIQTVNDGGTEQPERRENCMDVSRSLDVTYRGHPEMSASVVGGPENRGWQRTAKWLGQPLQPYGTEGFAGIRQDLREGGPGSTAIVITEWKNPAGGEPRGGHAFNMIYHDDGAIYVLDGQSGRWCEDEPPREGPLRSRPEGDSPAVLGFGQERIARSEDGRMHLFAFVRDRQGRPVSHTP